jgi:sugar O-acyltransferase (sialic acid O-acetyltransferase NeuD family)
MTKPLVIFGTGDIAELAHFYWARDTGRPVAAFTVDADYVKEPTFKDLPVVAFEAVAEKFAPGAHDMFVALSYRKINALRAEKCAAARTMGYALASYVSSRATVLTDHPIGDNAFILEDNTIQPFVRIGNNVTLWSGNHIGHHSVIEDDVFIASHVVVSGGVTIGRRSFIGVNATLRDHIKIGERSVIGAGALVLADTGDDAVFGAKATEKAAIPSSKLRSI